MAAEAYTIVQDVLQKIDDKSILAEQKVVLPIALRAVWTDEELQSFRLDSINKAQIAAKRAELGLSDAPRAAETTTKKSAAFPRSGKGKYSKVDDEWAAGVPGLIDEDWKPGRG